MLFVLCRLPVLCGLPLPPLPLPLLLALPQRLLNSWAALCVFVCVRVCLLAVLFALSFLLWLALLLVLRGVFWMFVLCRFPVLCGLALPLPLCLLVLTQRLRNLWAALLLVVCACFLAVFALPFLLRSVLLLVLPRRLLDVVRSLSSAGLVWVAFAAAAAAVAAGLAPTAPQFVGSLVCFCLCACLLVGGAVCFAVFAMACRVVCVARCLLGVVRSLSPSGLVWVGVAAAAALPLLLVLPQRLLNSWTALRVFACAVLFGGAAGFALVAVCLLVRVAAASSGCSFSVVFLSCVGWRFRCGCRGCSWS
jgi:hypothetical protein